MSNRVPDTHQVGATARTNPTIRSRLLLAVNLPLAALVAVFLVFDYSRELGQRLEDKRIALEEEAKTILPAVLQVRRQGKTGVKQYIDTVCGRMQDADSPHHHIAVKLDGETIQATAHHRASPQFIRAIRRASRSSSHRVTIGETELVIGSFEETGATVYVSESLEHLRSSVMRAVVLRLVGFALLAVVAGLVVNVVLFRIVSNPLDRLITTLQRIGGGQLGAVAEPFSTAELDYLAHEINAMSRSLAAADRDRKAQMSKAREIQRNLLPQDNDAPGINVAPIFKPAHDVGGDYYDLLPLDDEAWLICVADATGHGVPAAMTAAMLKTLLLQAAQRLTSPAEMLHFINQQFTAVNLVGNFVTMALVRANPRTGRLTYASAGHEPAWLLPRQGEVREMSSTGLVLGVSLEARWDEMVVDMSEGSRLLIVTDGVSETRNDAGRMFGRQQLATIAADNHGLPVGQAALRINEVLKDYRGDAAQTDDVTIVLIEMARDPTELSNKPIGDA